MPRDRVDSVNMRRSQRKCEAWIAEVAEGPHLNAMNLIAGSPITLRIRMTFFHGTRIKVSLDERLH
jgi:hypothetical protein